jgi:LEA14-like dessication related protein
MWSPLLSAVIGGGCSIYRDPALNVGQPAVHETTEQALTLRFPIDLQNPNEEPLKLLQLEYDVRVDGRTVYSGIRDAQATVASHGTRQVEIPAVVRYDDLNWTAANVPAQARYSISGKLQYVTPGEIAQILFDTGVRKPRAGFRAQGDVDLTSAERR